MNTLFKSLQIGNVKYTYVLTACASIINKVDLCPTTQVKLKYNEIKSVEDIVKRYRNGQLKERTIINYNVAKVPITKQLIKYNQEGQVILQETERVHGIGHEMSRNVYSNFGVVNDKWSWKTQSQSIQRLCPVTKEFKQHKELNVKRNTKGVNSKVIEISFNKEGKLQTGATKKEVAFHSCGTYKTIDTYAYNKTGDLIKTITLAYDKKGDQI